MINSRSLKRFGSVLALTAAAALSICSVGCAGKKDEVKHAQIKPGNMPAEGEWTGVYYSTVYGHLHLIKEGDTISGKWRTTSGDKWGEMNGNVTGDVFRYEWRENTIGVTGPTATTTGHGYFKYVVPKGENVEHEIHGEWGLGQSDAGQTWKAIKQRNQKPDPDSVMPDETQTNTGVDSWDETPGAKKKAPKKEESSDSEESSDDEWE